MASNSENFKFGDYGYEKLKNGQFRRRDRKGHIKTITPQQFYEVEREVKRIDFLRKRKENNEPDFETEANKIKAELQNFLVSVNKNKLLIDEKYDHLFEKYSQYAADNAYKVLAGQFQRMYVQYGILYKKFSEFYKKVEKNNQVLIKHREERITLLGNLDALGIKYTALFDKAESQEKLIEGKKELLKEKTFEKEEKIYQKSQENQRKAHIKAGKEYDRERAKQAKELEREKKLKVKNLEKQNKESEKSKIGESARREDIQSRWDIRKNQREESKKLEQLEAFKQKKLMTKSRVNDFFSGKIPLLHEGKKGLGLLGSALSGPLNAFGFDFSDEKQFLSSLFSPVTSLAKYGHGKVKSFTEKRLGVDDESIDNLDDVFNGQTGKNKKVDLGKVNSILGAVKNKSGQSKTSGSGIKSGLGKLGGLFGGGNSKNISNMFSRNNSQSKSTTTNNNANTNYQNVAEQQNGIDYNRADDKSEPLKETNGLLSEILKELKKQTGEKPKTSGSFLKKIPSIGLGTAALAGGAAIVVAGSKLVDVFKSASSSRETVRTVTSNTTKVLTDKLKKKGASQKDIDKVARLIPLEMDLKSNENSTNPELLKKFTTERKDIFQKYNKNKIVNNSLSPIDSVQHGASGSWLDSPTKMENDSSKVDSTIIKAQAKKIEKIKDDQESNKDMLDDLKKFFSGEFLDSFVEKFAGLLVASKGAGKSYMPSASPF